jgi:hypothetical protein
LPGPPAIGGICGGETGLFDVETVEFHEFVLRGLRVQRAENVN